jgi:nucleoside-diphosphate-sugar epimerase
MKILITGSRGNFPTALIPRLTAVGHELVLFDMEPMSAPDDCVSIQADIRDGAALVHAMRDCEAVVHACAYHGNSADSRNYDDYYGVNVTGTHNVLRAMALNGVRALVYSSSEAVYGDGMRGRRLMDDNVPCIPNHIYALTKAMGEEMCRFYARKHGFNIAMLRYGCFVPVDWKIAGLGRLNNWLDREDVAQANELALGAVIAEAFRCEAFLIQCAKPFADEDWPELETNPDVVVERYYPGALDILNYHHLRVPRVHLRYNIDKAITELGYDPQFNFEQFLSMLRRA